jgi:GTP-binding protein EngB required for normal cell division
VIAGGPPWPILGAGQPEPEKAAAAKAGQELADPAKAGPSTADPATAGPSTADPATAAPSTADPATAAPSTADPATAAPSTADPATAAPPTADPATAAPPTAGFATAGPPWEKQAAGGASPPSQAVSEPPPASPVLGLSARLTALTRLIQIAAPRTGDGFPETLVQDAEELVERAGERLRLSAGHTVVALAGGTGSGKSSIFNYLAGADFSAVGVTRPVTRDAHACVWGASGSGPLLEWLGVPRRFRYARGSVLDVGESSLNGLILLDLPDHDSVVGGASHQVDRLIGMADLMVWVLDPQKYADAAVHRRYLVPLAGHSEVIAVVLNQADHLSADQADECVADLRRLLDSEGLHNAWVLVTSAVTGAGMAQLRGLLAGAVAARRATSARISADLDGIAREFAPYAAEQAEGPGHEATAAAAPGAHEGGRAGRDGRVPLDTADELVDAFLGAAGVSAVADALLSARELRAVDYVGWPIAWLVERLTGRDPVRRIRLGRLWAELKSMATGPSGAQQADIDNALTKLADEVGAPLPKPWSQTTRSAARSRAEEIPAAIGAAMGESLPEENKITPWWRLVGALQGLLLGCVIVSLVWVAALLVFGVFHAVANMPRLFGDAGLLPWIVIMIAAFLLLGWLTAAGCMNLVRSAADRERGRVLEAMRARIGVLARDMVLIPVEQELAEYGRFRSELRIAAG